MITIFLLDKLFPSFFKIFIINAIIPDIENNDEYSMIKSIYYFCNDDDSSKRSNVNLLLCFILFFIENENI